MTWLSTLLYDVVLITGSALWLCWLYFIVLGEWCSAVLYCGPCDRDHSTVDWPVTTRSTSSHHRYFVHQFSTFHTLFKKQNVDAFFDAHRLYVLLAVWRSGSALASINEVNLRRGRLVLGWVAVTGFNSRCTGCISLCNQPPRSTQPGHLFVGWRYEYQPNGGVALWLGSKGRYGSCVGGGRGR